MSVIVENGGTVTECFLPKNVSEFYEIAGVQNVKEAITVLFHAYLLESGFLPKAIPEDDKYSSMPKGWNTNGVFKIDYMHKCCTAFTCSVSFVFLYNNVSLHGIVCDTACSDSVHLKINFKKYIKQKHFSSVNEVFCDLKEFSILFKDNFCLPFLNLLHEMSERPLSGLPGLYDEIKLNILRYLSVEQVLAMSALDKNFNYLASLPSLWKYMCQRDFFVKEKGGSLAIDSSSSSSSTTTQSTETNWKEVYKKEFLKRKTKRQAHYRVMFNYLRPRPPFFDFGTPIYTDFDPPFTIFDPPFPPYLQQRIPPYFRKLL